MAAWDAEKGRWWISIKATKTIKPNEEVKIPYGQAYKGLPGRKTKAAPAMRQVPVEVSENPMSDKRMLTSWRRAHGRAMDRLTQLHQQWRSAMAKMQQGVMRVNHNLRLWYQDICDRDRASDDHEPGDMSKTEAEDDMSPSHAQREQCPSRETTTGGSTPPVTNTRNTNKRVTWADNEGGELCIRHTYTKTTWLQPRGVCTSGRGRRRGRRRRGGRGHPMRYDQNEKIWKTIT